MLVHATVTCPLCDGTIPLEAPATAGRLEALSKHFGSECAATRFPGNRAPYR